MAAMIPSIVKIDDVNAVPIIIPDRFLFPAAIPSINATTHYINISENTLARMYSDTFAGDMAIAWSTF